MRPRPGLIPLVLAAALAWPCLALAQQDPSAPIAKGPSGAPPTSTTPVEPLGKANAWASADAAPDAPPRGVHGAVDVSVGTGGYRNVGGVVTAPVGQDGSVTIAADQETGGGWSRRGSRIVSPSPP
jgi:hypothetical protein